MAKQIMATRVTGWVVKPFRPEQMSAVIKQVRG